MAPKQLDLLYAGTVALALLSAEPKPYQAHTKELSRWFAGKPVLSEDYRVAVSRGHGKLSSRG